MVCSLTGIPYLRTGGVYHRTPEQPQPSLHYVNPEEGVDSNLDRAEYSGVGRNKEQSAKLLRHLVANAPKLVRPY